MKIHKKVFIFIKDKSSRMKSPPWISIKIPGQPKHSLTSALAYKHFWSKTQLCSVLGVIFTSLFCKICSIYLLLHELNKRNDLGRN